VAKYLARWAVNIGPAFVISFATWKWADWEYEQL
jgi:hypothetical protein